MSSESWPTALGSQGENRERTGESAFAVFFLSVLLGPLALSRCVTSYLLSFRLTTSSYIRFLHCQAGAAQENPLCSSRHVLTALREREDRLTHQRRHSFRSLLFCLFFSPSAASFLLQTTPLIYCTFALLSTWKVFLSH